MKKLLFQPSQVFSIERVDGQRSNSSRGLADLVRFEFGYGVSRVFNRSRARSLGVSVFQIDSLFPWRMTTAVQ